MIEKVVTSVENVFNVTDILDRKNSIIHGFGIFTNKFIKKSYIIFQTNQYEMLLNFIKGSVQVGPFMHLLELNVLRWINHSCMANSKIVFQNHTLMIVAKRDIQYDEEITCDYRDTEDFIPFPFYCNCGYCNRILIGKNDK